MKSSSRTSTHSNVDQKIRKHNLPTKQAIKYRLVCPKFPLLYHGEDDSKQGLTKNSTVYKFLCRYPMNGTHILDFKSQFFPASGGLDQLACFQEMLTYLHKTG
jgi:hypothetical protein